MPDLGVNVRETNRTVDTLLDLYRGLATLAPRHQTLAAETILVRAFSLLEINVASMAEKVLAGAKYLDGSSPVVTLPCRTLGASRAAMISHARAKPRMLKWTKASDIRKNLAHVLDIADHFVVTCDQSGSILNEMRQVRNHVAHLNDGTRRQFREVVRARYGGYANRVTPGNLLMSSRFSPRVIEEYLITVRVLVKDICKAP